jgi:hypothetical protein
MNVDLRHASLDAYLSGPGKGEKGPIALILAEDGMELDSTIRHHLACGFRKLILLVDADQVVNNPDPARVAIVHHPVLADGALATAANSLIAACPGQWIFTGYNAEYLFYPFIETRTVGELCTFHGEERRFAMPVTVVDLYAGDLGAHPEGVARNGALLDAAGYYALQREDPAPSFARKDRQIDLYGGLRWRFEEHVPWEARRIDRIALFRADPGLILRPDFTLSDEERNTWSCPWHHNVTAATLSFRAAKALRANPDSRAAIGDFRWGKSVGCEWSSQQLLDLGLMEPGQWF